MQRAITDIGSWIGRGLVGSDGDKIGTIKDIYLEPPPTSPSGAPSPPAC